MFETFSLVEFVVGSNAESSNDGLGHSTKKVRRRVDHLSEMEHPTVNKNGQSVPNTIVGGVSYKESLMGIGEDRTMMDQQEPEFQL